MLRLFGEDATLTGTFPGDYQVSPYSRRSSESREAAEGVTEFEVFEFAVHAPSCSVADVVVSLDLTNTKHVQVVARCFP